MLKTKYEIGFEISSPLNGQEVITAGLNSNSIYDSSSYVVSTNQSSNTQFMDSEPPNILEPTVPGYDFIEIVRVLFILYPKALPIEFCTCLRNCSY